MTLSKSKSTEKPRYYNVPQKFMKKTIQDMNYTFDLRKTGGGKGISFYNVKTTLTHPKAPSYVMGAKLGRSLKMEDAPLIINSPHHQKHEQLERAFKSKSEARLHGIVGFKKMRGRPQFEPETPEQISAILEKNKRDEEWKKSLLDHSNSRENASKKPFAPFEIQIPRPDIISLDQRKKTRGLIYDANWQYVRPSSQQLAIKTGDFAGPFRQTEFGACLQESKAGVLIRKNKPHCK